MSLVQGLKVRTPIINIFAIFLRCLGMRYVHMSAIALERWSEIARLDIHCTDLWQDITMLCIILLVLRLQIAWAALSTIFVLVFWRWLLLVPFDLRLIFKWNAVVLLVARIARVFLIVRLSFNMWLWRGEWRSVIFWSFNRLCCVHIRLNHCSLRGWGCVVEAVEIHAACISTIIVLIVGSGLNRKMLKSMAFCL